MALVNGIGKVNGYQIWPDADLTGANLKGANFSYAKVDPAHVPLIEAAKRIEIESLIVSGGRTSNPGLGTRRGPHGYKY